MATSGSRPIDFLITYRIIKLLVTPFQQQDAFKYGIIDKDGNVLRKYKTITNTQEKRSYTLLHRFVFNIKRLLSKVGLGSRLGSLATGLALLIKENKELEQHKSLIESTIIKHLKKTNQYNDLLKESSEIIEIDDTPYMNCFGIDIYEVDGQLISEYDYAKYKV